VATIYEYARERPWRSMVFVLRTALPPESLGVPAAGVIRSLDPAQPVEDLRTMSDLVAGTLRAQRFNAIVLLFAGVALALAAVGIYSVLSQLVRGRRREIGIRTALGARTTDVLRLVLYEGLAPTLAGILAGTAAALASGMLLRRLVFGVSPADPVTLTAVAGTLLVVALAASHVPGYRASRVDPLQVLRT
jgi:putative ABC transport system permease protein